VRLLDTSIWIEWLIGTNLAKQFGADFRAFETIVIPSIVQYELYKWNLRERTEQDADQVIAFTTSGVVVPINTAIATLAAELSFRHKLHATDALVYATSLTTDAPLVTCDAHFKGLPNIEYHEKV
jgi:predicted nucleic acid-binding protein